MLDVHLIFLISDSSDAENHVFFPRFTRCLNPQFPRFNETRRFHIILPAPGNLH